MSTAQVMNVEYLMVGATVSSAPVANEAFSDLDEGEIGVFSVDGLRRTNSDTDTRFVLAIGGANSKPLFVSDVITAASVTGITTKAGLAATEQQDSIGFSGTAGSITLTNSNLYMVTVYVQEYLTSSSDGRKIKHFQYNSDTAATEEEVAGGLVKSAIYNFQKEAEKYIVFEMMMATGSDAAVGTSVDDVVFTQNSKVISATDIDDGTGSAAFAVGDHIRIGTGATDEVYKIVAIDGAANTATLDWPFQGTTQTIADGSLARIPAASGEACGVLMTGQPLSNVKGKEFYKKARWETRLKNFGTTTQVREANADKGDGTYDEILQKEFFLEGFKGEIYRKGEPVIHPLNSSADSSKLYDMTTIQWSDNHVVGFTGNVSPKQLTLATPNDNGANDYMREAGEGVWAVLAGLTGLTVPAV